MIKAVLQESYAGNSLRRYRKRAKEQKLKILGKNELKSALHERLRLRKVHPKQKSKGNLHVFLVYSQTNWEYILPIALEPFGKITSFEWGSQGFDGDPSRSNWLESRADMNDKMLDEIKKAHSKQPIDALVGYLYESAVSPQVLKQISDMNFVIFNFNWDDRLGFNNLKNLASLIDLNLTNVPDSCIKYMVEGGLSMFWPEAAHPEIHRPYNIPFEFDVSFVGKKYSWRPRFVRYLQKKGIRVAAFGEGWENEPLSNEGVVKMYSKSRINLGFAGVGHSKKLTCLKERDFEVPMSGGLYLTQDNPELSLVYDVGREIVTYHNREDCVRKINYLLTHPKEADKIRKAGRQRALKEHTWEKRFGDTFKMAGIF